MTGTNSSGHALVTAAVLVIGDEILSGRTKDKNIGYIADYLTALGMITLRRRRSVQRLKMRRILAPSPQPCHRPSYCFKSPTRRCVVGRPAHSHMRYPRTA